MSRLFVTFMGTLVLMQVQAADSSSIHGLIDHKVLKLLAEETSGESAKRNLDSITLWHRTRAGSQFRQAAEHVRDQLHRYGLENARIMEFPADGKTLFGTQKSRPAWDVEYAELWEIDAEGQRIRRLADWESVPLSLAQDSLSGEASGELVDIGPGTSEADYEGLDVNGKLVLTESQPGAVADLALGRFGAAGIVSYAPNQRSAWWKEDDRLVRWGHIGSFPEESSKGFGFMISLGEARRLQSRLSQGETILLDASVEARHSSGNYLLTTAVIPGADPKRGAEEILFTCHLDHPRPGANDNASGCVAILEIARTLKTLIDRELIARPRRSIRFVWPAEIEGTLIYLNARPDLASNIRANIHMDMVGGNQNTKAVYRISGGPLSLPNFIADVGHAIGEFVNAQTLAHTSGQQTEFPLTATEGGKEPLLAQMEGISMGSDHDILREGSWRVPGLYLHDWPDRYIHTNFDTAGNIDPTKLKRSAFIGAVSGLFLADLDENRVPAILALLRENALRRAADLERTRGDLEPSDAASISNVHWAVEAARLDSVEAFATITDAQRRKADEFLRQLRELTGGSPAVADATGEGALVYRRNADIKGPMHAFGYSYLEDHLSADAMEALTLSGAQAYEALNLVDGQRNVSAIRDWLTAEFGPIDEQAVVQYLKALESIGVIGAN